MTSAPRVERVDDLVVDSQGLDPPTEKWLQAAREAADTDGIRENAYAERHPGREPSTLTFLACGAVSSTIGQAVAYPLQVVRTRLQAQGLPGMPAYDGVVDCLRRTVADGGVRALYNGFLPNFAKALPAISISYAVFEKTKRLLLGKRRGLADGTS